MPEIREINTEGRHPSVQEICSFFRYDHLGNPVVASTSKIFFDTAEKLISTMDDGPLLTNSLHRLFEAKNYAVCHAVVDQRREGEMR